MLPDDVIAHLKLQPLEFEGGWYRESYRSQFRIGDKSLATTIFYLITPTSYSRMHRLPTDELFHFYLGDPVQQLQLHPDGSSRVVTLGPHLFLGQSLQCLVPAHVWQGSRLADGGHFALLGTTMSPGFDPADLEIADREMLVKEFPTQQVEIERLTRINNSR